MVDILHQLDVHPVVNRAPAGMVLIQSSDIGIDAAESTRRAEIACCSACADTYVVGRIETHGCKSANRGTIICRQSWRVGNVAAICCSCSLDRSSSAKCESVRNSSRRCVLIKERNVARVVDVGSVEIVQANVADVVGSENQSWSQFSLETNVHLNGTRRLVIRIEKPCGKQSIVRKGGWNKGRVRPAPGIGCRKA